MKHLSLAALLCLGLAACGGTEKLITVPPAPVPQQSVRIGYSTVEVRSVSLPSYAAREEIHVRAPDGTLAPSDDLLWADDPARAVTLELTRYLAQLTGAQVASEPWPFLDPAQARVEVRVEELLAVGESTFVMTGQYFVAPDLGRRNRSGLFSLSAPIVPGTGVQGIAAARAQVVRELAETIARSGLR